LEISSILVEHIRVARLEEIEAMKQAAIIARAGKPVAMLSPIEEVPQRRVPGIDAGVVIISPDFDEPLEEFEV
jgi:antitoxin (DNA-binding transcriptional repressor) of toxin-antitoxin stability system